MDNLYTFSSINNHIGTVDKGRFIRGKIQTHIGYIVRIGKPAQGHIGHKFSPIFRGVGDTDEHLEEACTRQERADVVDADLMAAVFGGETFCSLSSRSVHSFFPAENAEGRR